MAIHQLSVYAQNRKGTLVDVVKVLSDANIDLRSICVADTETFGILRLIVNDNEKAYKVLREADYMVRIREVVAISLEDKPGALSDALQCLADADINLEYMYSVINSERNRAYMVLRVDDNEHAEQVLTAHGIKILSEEKAARE